MKKQKIFVLMLAIILVCSMALILVACEFDKNDKHTHSWASEWSMDDTYHFHKCSGCDEVKDKAEHSYSNGKCVCGKTENSSVETGKLKYKLSDDGSYAICLGYDNVIAGNVVIADEYEGKPVKEIGENAFSSTIVENVTIGKNVEKISTYAFYNCKKLKNITIPNNVKELGKGAFYYAGLEKISIPDSVTTLGDFVFMGCASLTDAVIGNGMTTIPTYTFRENSKLANVKLGENITSIGTYAFYKCTSLKSIVLPSKLDTIIEYAFCACENLSNVTLPSSLKNLGGYAFKQCAMTEVVIPESVTTVGTNAYWQCPNIKKVTIKNSAVGKKMFKECANLEEVIIDGAVTTIGGEVFDECPKLRRVEVNNSVSGTGTMFYYNNQLNDIVISENVEELAPKMFYYCKGICEVTIPSNVKKIGTGAFAGCDAKVVYCESKESEVTGSFSSEVGVIWNCNSSTKKIDPLGNGWVVKDGLRYCIKGGSTNYVYFYVQSTALSGDIVIADTINYGGTEVNVNLVGKESKTAILTANGVTSVTLGKNIKEITLGAFQNCKMESITFNDKLEKIGEEAFKGCKNLKAIRLPASVSMTANPFIDCPNLQILEVETGNQYYRSENNCIIGRQVSGDIDYVTLRVACKNSIIPSDVTKIAQGAFQGQKDITSVKLPNGLLNIGPYAFYNCTSLSSISIPSSVTYIDKCAFYNCENITSLTIPEGITSINYSSFSNCGFTEIVIPNSVKYVDDDAFRGCKKLKKITFPATISKLPIRALWDCNSLEQVVIDNSNTLYDCVNGNLVSKDGKTILLGMLNSAIPSGVEIIGEYAYSYRDLTTFEIPSGVTTIGRYAFILCEKLESITIPSSVTSIETYALNGCKALTTINFKGTKAQWNAITKGSSWNNSTSEYTIVCTDGSIKK